MAVTALCATLLTNGVLLLAARHQEVDSLIIRVKPDRLQFFELESMNITCEGPEEEVSCCRTTNQTAHNCSFCFIGHVFPLDSGEYWCESAGGTRSSSINITVTGGLVILDSPALPVTEGDPVTQRCRTNPRSMTSSNLTADFYKDDLLIGNSSTAEMTIHSVSQSDEGLYRCRISDGAESPPSRLTVTGTTGTTWTKGTTETTGTTGTKGTTGITWTSWITVTVLVMVLLAVGLLYYLKGFRCRAAESSAGSSPEMKDNELYTSLDGC